MVALFLKTNEASAVQRCWITLLNYKPISGRSNTKAVWLVLCALNRTATQLASEWLSSLEATSAPCIIHSVPFMWLIKHSLHHSCALLASGLLVFQTPNPGDIWRVTWRSSWKYTRIKYFKKSYRLYKKIKVKKKKRIYCITQGTIFNIL